MNCRAFISEFPTCTQEHDTPTGEQSAEAWRKAVPLTYSCTVPSAPAPNKEEALGEETERKPGSKVVKSHSEVQHSFMGCGALGEETRTLSSIPNFPTLTTILSQADVM